MHNVIDNYAIIRVFQEDVWDNKYEWEDFIKNAVAMAGEGVLYISEFNHEMYSDHIKDFDTLII